VQRAEQPTFLTLGCSESYRLCQLFPSNGGGGCANNNVTDKLDDGKKMIRRKMRKIFNRSGGVRE
jgi:hypothetical protein